jgi:nucleoside-diphosphate kinase
VILRLERSLNVGYNWGEMIERTVVLVKPDGVKRALIGKIISRFEESGLKIVGMKMVWVTDEHVGKHYAEDESAFRAVGEKTLKFYEEYGRDVNEWLGTDDPVEIGRMMRKWNMEYLSSGPVVAMVLEGVHAVATVRKIVGSTFPNNADPGTIRATYSIDSPVMANVKKRPVRNLIHASGNVEEAEFEIKLWFHENELHVYTRADEAIMFE